MKKLLIACSVLILLLLLLSTPGFADPIKKNIEVTYNNIQLIIDGTKITPKDVNGNIVEPFIYNGTTYLPVRAVGEALGKTVDWDGATQTVYIGDKPATATPPSAGSLKIGALLPLSGSEAAYGQDMLNSYKIAIEEVNTAGGVLGHKLAIVSEDDVCDPAQAYMAGGKIIAGKADFIVGGYCSGATIPALQMFADANKLMLISAANSTHIINMSLPQTFMLNSPSQHQATKLIELMKKLEYKNVAIIHQGDDYSKSLSNHCDKILPPAGYTIVATDIMQRGAQDISAIVNKILTANADMVLWCGYPTDGSNAIKQLRSGGYTGGICVGDGSSDNMLITGTGSQGDGVYVLSPPYVNFAKGGQEYIVKYKALNKGAEPGPYSGLCYDTIMLLVDGIKRAGTIETSAVAKAIAENNYQGLSGSLAFSKDHTLLKPNFIVLKINAATGNFELFL